MLGQYPIVNQPCPALRVRMPRPIWAVLGWDRLPSRCKQSCLRNRTRPHGRRRVFDSETTRTVLAGQSPLCATPRTSTPSPRRRRRRRRRRRSIPALPDSGPVHSANAAAADAGRLLRTTNPAGARRTSTAGAAAAAPASWARALSLGPIWTQCRAGCRSDGVRQPTRRRDDPSTLKRFQTEPQRKFVRSFVSSVRASRRYDNDLDMQSGGMPKLPVDLYL